MATLNPFDLLVDDDAEDPSQLIAAAQKKVVAAVAQPNKLPAQVQAKSAPACQQTSPAQLPSKPFPTAQAVREVRYEGGRGGGRGRGGGGFNHDQAYDATSLRDNRALSIQSGAEDGETEKLSERHGNGGSRAPYRNGRRGGLRNGDFGDGERPRRAFERHSGTERGGGRGGGGFNRDQAYDATSLRDNRAPSIQGGAEDGETEKLSERHGNDGYRAPYRGGRRGGLRNVDFGDGERPRRAFERHSGTGRGGGRGGGGFNCDQAYDATSLRDNRAPSIQGGAEDGETEKLSERHGNDGYLAPYRGGPRGGLRNVDFGDGERPRRAFEHHSGTGRGSEVKRDGAGRGNWGTLTNEITEVTEELVNETEKHVGDEKTVVEEDVIDINKENIIKEPEEKEPEDKEMTLDEYEKVLEEKRKALQELKTKERKVDAKEFESMQQLSNKKEEEDVFIKLGSDKDKRKESSEKEERSKKSVNIANFLKPGDRERYNGSGGRGRGRGRGSREGYGGGNLTSKVAAPSIEDPGQFPTLGAK